MGWLVDKEWRELMSSRAWWVLLVAMGPLVGMSFISAVTTYGELSGVGGSAAGVGEAFSPLVGIWAPTFSACELAAAFLLPFVGIRLVSGDRQSGALKIELQHPMSALTRIAIKGGVLLAGWLVATAAPLVAVALWVSYGGSVSTPELGAVVAGHVLNAGLTVALAAAMASITEHPSTAAILTLTVTVGTWLLNFAAAVNGGLWERAAVYTPTAMVAEFQRGLVRADLVLVSLALIAGGLMVAAIWLRLGEPVGRRVRQTIVAALVVATACGASALVTASWDLSESRQNSFSEQEEAALRTITGRLMIEAHLAPEDPRRSDLEHRALRKLRRVMPSLDVRYVSETHVGLFEQTADHYGEIWYALNGRREMSRVTTAEGVLESIFRIAGVAAPSDDEGDVFRGHPLAVRPRGAAAVFYGVWPVTIAGAAWLVRRRRI